MDQRHLQSWWLEHPCGQHILEQVQEQLLRLLGQERYGHVLQLGLPEVNLLSKVQIQNRHVLAQEEAPILADWEYLPLATESMDLVIVPFVLSQHPNRHAVLREAQRVLCGYGQLVILDFNPHSLWRVQSHRFNQFSACTHQHSITPKRMTDWLQLLDLQPQVSRFIHYAPLCKDVVQLQKWQWLELAGNRWWPHMAAMYAMVAIKQVVYLKPLAEHKHRQRREKMNLNPVSVRKPE